MKKLLLLLFILVCFTAFAEDKRSEERRVGKEC